MKDILPDALFIGFTGTPLLKADKQKSIEVFGRYIHTYKFNEAVSDGVVLDLRYEARDIDQIITSQQKMLVCSSIYQACKTYEIFLEPLSLVNVRSSPATNPHPATSKAKPLVKATPKS